MGGALLRHSWVTWEYISRRIEGFASQNRHVWHAMRYRFLTWILMVRSSVRPAVVVILQATS